MTGGGVTSMATPTSTVLQHSAWHSPMPYLFGGLAAMLGLIAFALLILACSYWKLSTRLMADTDLEAGDHKTILEIKPKKLEDKVVVIMAGDVKPTFLATPVSSLLAHPKSINSSSVSKIEQEDESLKQPGHGNIQQSS